uniref:Calpain 9 n=1 Tax=Astyanax mexicanus TaxID=7994 RepID=A0A8B9K0I4_ASTMX
MPSSSTLSGGPAAKVSAESIQADGRTYEELRQECLKKNKLFEDPDFPACDSSLFFSQAVPVNFEWKRPGEICKDPKYILGGADRTDICQGQLGDCWLLAAIASLTLHKETLARVIQPDQSFDRGYAGIFRFQFWQHNKWLEVVVDDRLPCVRNQLVFLHSADNNEFWSALLEKAYAGGVVWEVHWVMYGFRGGAGGRITSSAESEAQTASGLVKGHAYSITGLTEVDYIGKKVKLIRVRNPWGQVEWNGPWSDNSREWSGVDKAEKTRVLENSTDDGEFWMEFEDFKANYDRVEICNLTPDSLMDDTKKKWVVNVLEGNWIRGSTAGGCRNFIDTFWTNPQFKLKLEDADGDGRCSVIVALMQKNRRKLRKEGLDLETIGFAIYQAPNDEDHLEKDFFRFNSSKARSRTYINMREISERFSLEPGSYLVVPTTFQPHIEADFALRVFSESKAEAIEMGNTIEADLPDVSDFLYTFYIPYIYINTAVLGSFGTSWMRKEIKFDGLTLNTCHSIINLMDVDNSGMIEFQEFKVFWEKLKKWMMLFLSYDTDRSGRMSSYELRLALKAVGIQLNNTLLQLICLRFADKKMEIDFDDYLTCIVRLENMFRKWLQITKIHYFFCR